MLSFLVQALSIFLYPSPPFYLNADISNLPFGTVGARGFFVLKTPFHLLPEAWVLLVFMKARALSLLRAVNLL